MGKYYEMIFTCRVLTDREEPSPQDPRTAIDLLHECIVGGYVGEVIAADTKEVSAQTMSNLMLSANASPSMFALPCVEEAAAALARSASVDGCSPDLVVITREAFNQVMETAGLESHKLTIHADD